jgi:hypothetical protein
MRGLRAAVRAPFWRAEGKTTARPGKPRRPDRPPTSHQRVQHEIAARCGAALEEGAAGPEGLSIVINRLVTELAPLYDVTLNSRGKRPEAAKLEALLGARNVTAGVAAYHSSLAEIEQIGPLLHEEEPALIAHVLDVLGDRPRWNFAQGRSCSDETILARALDLASDEAHRRMKGRLSEPGYRTLAECVTESTGWIQTQVLSVLEEEFPQSRFSSALADDPWHRFRGAQPLQRERYLWGIKNKSSTLTQLLRGGRGVFHASAFAAIVRAFGRLDTPSAERVSAELRSLGALRAATALRLESAERIFYRSRYPLPWMVVENAAGEPELQSVRRPLGGRHSGACPAIRLQRLASQADADKWADQFVRPIEAKLGQIPPALRGDRIYPADAATAVSMLVGEHLYRRGRIRIRGPLRPYPFDGMMGRWGAVQWGMGFTFR